jgi:predicted amidohydrolase
MSPLRITLVQSHLHWEDKAANLKMLENKMAAVPSGGVVLLPEMFNTGFSMRPDVLAEPMEGPTVAWMKAMAARHRCILAGSLMIAEAGHYYNRLIWMQPNGQAGHYDKRHLFAYAGEDKIASVNGWKINLQVCYDLRFPVWARQQLSDDGEPEYDVLVYVANWPERRVQAWKTLLQARAIENQCYVVGVNRTGHDGHGIYHSGDSMVVDPLGEVVCQFTHDEVVHSLELDATHLNDLRRKLPFLADADDFYLLG